MTVGSEHLELLALEDDVAAIADKERKQLFLFALHVTWVFSEDRVDHHRIERKRFQKRSACEQTRSRKRTCEGSRRPCRRRCLRQCQRRVDHLCVIRSGGRWLVRDKEGKEP